MSFIEVRNIAMCWAREFNTTPAMKEASVCEVTVTDHVMIQVRQEMNNYRDEMGKLLATQQEMLKCILDQQSQMTRPNSVNHTPRECASRPTSTTHQNRAPHDNKSFKRNNNRSTSHNEQHAGSSINTHRNIGQHKRQMNTQRHYFKDVTCYKCNNIGHIARNCKATKHANINDAKVSITPTSGDIITQVRHELKQFKSEVGQLFKSQQEMFRLTLEQQNNGEHHSARSTPTRMTSFRNQQNSYQDRCFRQTRRTHDYRDTL